ncbi:hypothetical protein [Curvivirga sp.]|uniref:hypothetical protein n=1 Tax=Curvivirga sp. TaxID=2856848 RepID=UPI003B5A1DAB
MSDMSLTQDTVEAEIVEAPQPKKSAEALNKLRFVAGNLSRTVSYFLGLTVLVLGGAVAITKTSVTEIASWAESILGYGFIGLLAILIAGSLFSLANMTRQKNMANCNLWLETGLHMAGGITTLALTFTLLGISLGIGGLSEQALTPETVQDVIRSLTAQFSLAFMTTVIGLPTAALLRGALLISHAHIMTKNSEAILENQA